MALRVFGAAAALRGAPWAKDLHKPAWALLQEANAVVGLRDGTPVDPLL